MTAPLHDRPSVPLTWAEQDRFADLAVLASARAPHVTRYRCTPPARRLARRIARSPFADHVRASVDAAFWPAVICSGVLLALTVLTYLQSLTPVTGGIR